MGTLLGKLKSYFSIKYAILLIPVCGFAVYDSVFQAFASILGMLHEAYPDISVTSLQIILSIPPLMSIPGTLISGFLSSYIHNKYIAEFALGIIFVGGMIPVVVPDPTIESLYICGICIGIGQGFLHPLANAIICQRWSDDIERSKVLGFKQAFNYIGEILVTLSIGFLALWQWRNAFFVYLGIIPVFIVTALFLPKDKLDAKLVSKKNHFEGLKELITPKIIYLLVLFSVAAMLLYGYYTNIALLVQERQLGNTADIAAVSSTVSIVSCILGIAYGIVSKTLKRFTLMTGFIILSAGMIIVALANNMVIVFLGAVLIGFGCGIQQISTIFYISKVASPRVVTLAISLALCGISLGYSCAPMVLGQIQIIISGQQSAMVGLMVAGGGYAILAVIEFVRSGLFERILHGEDSIEEQ